MNYVFSTKPYQQRLGYLICIIFLTSPIKSTKLKTLQRKMLHFFKKKNLVWNPKKKVKDVSHTRDIIQWTTTLDIISERRHKWTWKGHVLNSISDNFQSAFTNNENSELNPLNGENLTDKQKLFFIYTLIERDGFFLIPFTKSLIKENEFNITSDKNFTDDDFRLKYKSSWENLASALVNSPSYKQRKEGRTLFKNIEILKARTLYIKALSKLEPLVDLNFLSRASKKLAHYKPNKERLDFFNSFPVLPELIRRDQLDNFMKNEFFKKWSETMDITEYVYEEERKIILEKNIVVNYKKLVGSRWQIINRNALALLTCLKSIYSEPTIVVDFNEVLNAQIQLSTKYGSKEVQLIGNYVGKLSSIKISNDAQNLILKS